MPNYALVITTFDKRFEPFLVPLLTSIKAQRPTLEVIVAINGRAQALFSESYRQAVLAFLAQQTNTYPIVFPNFQSLAKLWNRGVLTATTPRVLVLNDYLKIGGENGDGFFDSLEKTLADTPTSFRINGSFSHFVINKEELIEVGFFDERLLGLGEEDGDFFWRYYQRYDKEIASVDLPFIENVQSDLADDGYTKGIRTASQFNRNFIKEVKYKTTLLGGYRGMFDERVKKALEDEKQYPYEKFYWDNKNQL
jgi:hypothetical protein